MRARILLPAILAVSIAGCDDVLTTSPVTTVKEDEAITNEGSAAAAVAGMYDGLQDGWYYGGDYHFLVDLAGDDVSHTGTFPSYADVDIFNVIADNGSIGSIWDEIYQTVGRANSIIAKLPDVEMGAETRDQFLGEAYFVRALTFHDLVKMWGDIPTPTAPMESPEQAAQITRTAEADVYTQIVSDLDQAASLMSDASSTTTASLGAVEALRSRVLLYMEDWQGVVDAADAVEAMGYTLAPTYPDLFTASGSATSEDIFRIAFTPVEYSYHGYYYLSYDLGGRREIAPTGALASAYEAGDARYDHTIAIDSDGGYYSPKYPTSTGSEDIHVVRFGEVILNKAEALAQLGQLDAAVDEYNRIRARAGLADHVLNTDVSTQQEVLEAVWQERRLELALEGQRFPDLVRTGRAVDILGIEEYQTLWPIPQDELDVSPNLTQNDGY